MLFQRNILHSGYDLPKDDIDTKRLQVVNFSLLIGIPVFILFAYIHYGLEMWLFLGINITEFVLFAGSFFLLRRSLKYMRTAINAVLIVLFLAQIQGYINGGIYLSGFYWHFVLPIFTTVLLPTKESDRWLIFMVTVLLVMFGVLQAGVYEVPYNPVLLIFLLVTLLVEIAVLRFFQKVQQKHEQDLREVKQELEVAHQHTQDSIKYAAMIQSAVMPESDYLSQHFQDSFMHWQPKDIVGGDIYFVDELKGVNRDELLMILIDCSGHGVPGALVTMLVKALERQIVAEINSSDQPVSPAKILADFNRRMKKLLGQEGKHRSGTNAGFDGSVLTYNKKSHTLRFAGSHSSLYVVDKGELRIIRGDRHSVGYHQSNANYEFSEHILEINEDATVYMTTDGYLDQNGGNKGFPFGTRRFIQIIEEHHHKPLQEQKEIFMQILDEYSQEHQRNDDIAMLGFRIVRV